MEHNIYLNADNEKTKDRLRLSKPVKHALGVVGLITAGAITRVPLIDFLQKIAPEEIFTQFNGMKMGIPISANIESVINLCPGVGLMAIALYAGGKIALSNLSTK